MVKCISQLQFPSWVPKQEAPGTLGQQGKEPGVGEHLWTSDFRTARAMRAPIQP